MPRRNKTRYALLGLLGYGPMSGYDIKKMSDGSISHFWNENYGAIYPELRRLEEEGLAARHGPAGTGLRERKAYRVTQAGRDELHAWLEQPPDPPVLRVELLLKLFFGRAALPERMLEMVRDERARSEGALKELETIEDHINSERCLAPERHTEAPWWLMTVRYGKLYYEAIIQWCDETLAEVKRMTGETKE